MGRHRRRLISAFTSASLARARFESVFRLTQNRPLLEVAQIPRRPGPGGTRHELDQPGLTGVQLQPEPGEPAAQLVPEPLGIVPVLEPDDEVVREPDDDHITVRVALSPPVGPQVQA
jgi:hypothetical protein